MATVTRTGFYPLGSTRPLRIGTSRDLVATVGKITFSSSYTTGGESVSPGSLGLKSILLFVPSVEGLGSGIDVHFDYTNNKAIAVSGSSEVANNTDLSSVSFRFLAIGPALD